MNQEQRKYQKIQKIEQTQKGVCVEYAGFEKKFAEGELKKPNPDELVFEFGNLEGSDSGFHVQKGELVDLEAAYFLGIALNQRIEKGMGGISSLFEELENRGFDLSTLKFSISKKKS